MDRIVPAISFTPEASYPGTCMLNFQSELVCRCVPWFRRLFRSPYLAFIFVVRPASYVQVYVYGS
jgi:hypothetical protein